MKNLVKTLIAVVLLSLFIGICSKNQDNDDEATKKSDVITEKHKEADSRKRKKIVEELNSGAKEWQSQIIYSLDPNDDTTLQMNAYKSEMTPGAYGGWETFPELHGHDINALKMAGFNKIRVYTSASKDYKLRPLL